MCCRISDTTSFTVFYVNLKHYKLCSLVDLVFISNDLSCSLFMSLQVVVLTFIKHRHLKCQPKSMHYIIVAHFSRCAQAVRLAPTRSRDHD